MKVYIKASTGISYNDFKQTYNWLIKKYPDVTGLLDDGTLDDGYSLRYKIILNEDHYTKNGRRWELTESEESEISVIQYANIFDATPFFKSLGGTEKVSKSYTYAGYIPVAVESVSPDKNKKTIRKITIEKR